MGWLRRLFRREPAKFDVSGAKVAGDVRKTERVDEFWFGGQLYHVGVLVESQPGAQPCDDTWMLGVFPHDDPERGVTLTWRGVDSVEFPVLLAEKLETVGPMALTTRVLDVIARVNASHREPFGEVSRSGGAAG